MSDLAELVRKYVSEDEVVEICRDLVRAPSENPPGNEEAVAKAAASWLQSLGLDCQFVEPLPGRVSTISSWGNGTGPTLLFNGHYDVVPVPDPDAWPHPPFAAVVEDGMLYGRGSVDMKSGIAACLGAVSALQRAGVKPNGRLLMHFVADEEALGTHGARFLVENGYCTGVSEALVGEPSDMHLVTSERGALWLRIVTKGKAAHGSTPQLGTSAVHHMAKVVEAVYGMRFPGKLHTTLGKPTVNVGTIHGGSKVNMVADHCEIEIDRRTLPGETTEEILGEFEAALAELDFRPRVEVIDGAEASETPPGSRIVSLLAEGREAFGIDASEIGYAGATDARFLINQGRIPSVVCGPGDLLQAHTVGEHLEISQLVDATRVYAHAFARFLGTT